MGGPLKKKLGELLVEAGLIDELQLKAALSHQKQWGDRLGSHLVKRGLVSEQDILSVMEKQLGLSSITFDEMPPLTPDIQKLIPYETAEKLTIYPVKLSGRILEVATSDPTDLKLFDDLGFKLGVRVQPVLAHESDIQDAIQIHYGINPDCRAARLKEIEMRQQAVKRISEAREFEIIHHDNKTDQTKEAAEPPRPQPPPSQRSSKAVMNERVLNSLINLLIDKGVFTREELLTRLRPKKKP